MSSSTRKLYQYPYPLLTKTLEGENFSEHAIVDEGESLNYGSEAAGVLHEAVEAERERLREFQRTEATTERGKDIQRQNWRLWSLYRRDRQQGNFATAQTI